MKNLIFTTSILVAMFGLSSTVHAQVTTAAGAASNASVNNASVSVANAAPGAPGAPGIANLNLGVSPSVSINSTGADLGKSVPLVTAPQMTVLGGEDSCLKSRSGGGAFSGFGASFGTMVMDNECNRRVLSKTLMNYNQPELAVAVLCGSPQMWAAAERVAQFKKARGQNVMSVCHNEQPNSADVVSIAMRADQAPEVGGGAEDGLPWSYKEGRHNDDNFIYTPLD